MSMRISEKQEQAIKRLMQGDYKEEFGAFLGALSNYAAMLNEALIYGKQNEAGTILPLETRRGMTLAVCEIVKAVEKATQSKIVQTEDTSDGPT